MQTDNTKLDAFRCKADYPNPKQTWAEFDAELEMWLRLVGTFYVWLVPNHAGMVMEVCVLSPADVFAVRGKDGQPEHYTVRHQPPRWLMMPKEWMARPPKVEFCNWCPDPHHPSPKHHPGGQVEHALPKPPPGKLVFPKATGTNNCWFHASEEDDADAPLIVKEEIDDRGSQPN